MMDRLELHPSIGKRQTMRDLIPTLSHPFPPFPEKGSSTISLFPLSKRGKGKGEGLSVNV